MRRSGQASRPRASTCCFLSSLKTFAIPAAGENSPSAARQRPAQAVPLAGFQVMIVGRIWVITETIVERREDAL
jgi:hypothetical protein